MGTLTTDRVDGNGTLTMTRIASGTVFHSGSLIVVFLMLVGGCGGSNETSESENQIRVQLNWFPESEHGGVFQAEADGDYQEAGLNIEIIPGGRATPIGAELQRGRVQFAIANADDVILFQEQGIDVVAVMAAMQDHPRCILARKDSGVESFDDLAGKTFQRQPGRAFVEFMRSQGLLKDVQEVPYSGRISSLIADPNIVCQGYSCAEPLLAEQQGVEVTTLMVSDLGFNPYSSVLVTTQALIDSDPELVQTFVEITREGWRKYLADGQSGNRAILSANQEGTTEEALKFGAEAMRELAMPDGASPDSIGMMTAQRWSELYDQLVELKLVDGSKVNVEECYSLQFIR